MSGGDISSNKYYLKWVLKYQDSTGALAVKFCFTPSMMASGKFYFVLPLLYGVSNATKKEKTQETFHLSYSW